MHNFIGGEFWKNGKLIWKYGVLMTEVYERETPFKHPLLEAAHTAPL